jgi:hypothetical protein
MGYSAYRMEQSRKERLAMEAEDERKRMAPIVALTEKLQKSGGALRVAQIDAAKDAAIRHLRHMLTSQPSVDFSTEPYDGRFNSAEEVRTAISNAFCEWLSNGSPLPSQEDGAFVRDFASANATACDLTRASTFQHAWEYILEAFQQIDEFTETAIKETFGAPEPVVSVVSPEEATYSDGTPITELDSETVGNPVFRSACQSICDTSNKPMSGLEAKRLYRHFAENSGNSGQRYGRLSVATIRRAARDLWSDELVGLLPEEARAKDEARIWETMPATEARKALKIPLSSNQKPAIAYPRQQ